MTAPLVAPPDYDEQRHRELLVTVLATRIAMHSANAAALQGVLRDLGAGFNVAALRSVVDPHTNYVTRRARARDEIARQLGVLGLTARWRQVAVDAHTAAITGGVAAAAHYMSNGLVPAAPAPPKLPDSFDPAPWVRAQHRGMGGDVAMLLTPARVDDVTDWDLEAVIEAGAGAQYYLDEETSAAFLSGSVSQYAAFGVGWVNWMTVGDVRVCSICGGYEDQNPWPIGGEPFAPHGGCRCWLVPADGPMDASYR